MPDFDSLKIYKKYILFQGDEASPVQAVDQTTSLASLPPILESDVASTTDEDTEDDLFATPKPSKKGLLKVYNIAFI
jgi:hypothetical protein